MPPHRFTAVSPRQRHRDLATHPAGADQHRVPRAALEVKNLQSLTDQWVERVRDNDETQIDTARLVTMPPPWARAGIARRCDCCPAGCGHRGQRMAISNR